MARIEEAFDVITKQTVKISDYKDFKNNNKFFQYGFRPLICKECGDSITYCEGEINKPYFKHSPTAEGHSYCSLYTEGVSSNAPECKLRKKIFEEENISLNYEIICINGNWKSVITLPPLKNSEIEFYEKNNTVINIKNDDYFRFFEENIEINKENFYSGEIKRITFDEFPRSIKISITGNSNFNNIFYEMSCFKPECQIYSSLILQKYSTLKEEDDFIDLSNLPFFSCKKINGNLYIGEHYLLFSDDPILFSLNFFNAATFKEIKFNNFNYTAYDIVFNEANEEVNEFLMSYYNCTLQEKLKPIIVWPPIKTIGNYCYFKAKSSSKLFVACHENKSVNLETIDLCKNNKNPKIFLKILKNERPFYITYDNRNLENKPPQDIQIANLQNDKDFNYYFLFRNNVLISKKNKKELKNNDDVLYFNNQLDKYYKFTLIDENIEINNFFEIVRYSRKFEKFDDDKFNMLIEIYKNNKEIFDFLIRCKEIGTIKSDVIRFLIERS